MSYQVDSGTKFKRNYRACLNCRTRKVKCDLGSVDSPRDGKCVRCLRERKDCIFVESKRGGSVNVIAGRKRKMFMQNSDNVSELQEGDGSNDFYQVASGSNPLTGAGSSGGPSSSELNQEPPVKKPHHSDVSFATAQGALVFLAKAAGTIAEADERDRIDARAKHQQFEKMNQTRDSPASSVSPPYLGSPGSSQKTRVHSLSNILNTSKTNERGSTPQENNANSNFHSFASSQANAHRLAMPPAENSDWVRPTPSSELGNIDYIGPRGILTEHEAETLINLFFSTMHPFFPFIPKILHNPQVLAGYPILLCTILTISSRCHSFEGFSDRSPEDDTKQQSRNIEVHDRLWLCVQRLISQTVWAEASTRSIGTVFAFLLFTEWNPRAIHWRWSDYANRPDDHDLETDSYYTKDLLNHKKKEDDGANLAGLGAMRRSDRMAWMLIGSAVRLGQDMGFLERSCKTFLATHVAEINSVMNMSRRSMLSHSISGVEVDFEFEGDKEFKHLKNTSKHRKVQSDSEDDEDDEDDLILNGEDNLKPNSEIKLKFKFSQMAKIELLQIMSLGYESLYGYKAQLGGLNQKQNLSVLSILTPLLTNWGIKYKRLLVMINPKLYNNHNVDFKNPKSKIAREIHKAIDKESLIFDFHYAKLYIYSLALSPSRDTNKKSRGKNSLKLEDVSKSARFIEIAFNSAKEILSVAHRVHKLRMLKYMPVRWITRIVRAVAFVVKCYMTLTAHNKNTNPTFDSTFDAFDSTILSLSLISADQILQTIQKAAITLREASPDELHLCTRYSNVLMYLCSEMKSKSKNFSSDDDRNEQLKQNVFESELPSNQAEPVAEKRQEKDFDHMLPLPTQMNSRSSLYSQHPYPPTQTETHKKSSPHLYQEFHRKKLQSYQHPQQSFDRPYASVITTPSTSMNFNVPLDVNTQLLSSNYPQIQQSYAADQSTSPQTVSSAASVNINMNNDTNRTNNNIQNNTNESYESDGKVLFDTSRVYDWFANNDNVGLDFVEPWTEMIEQHLNSTDFRFGDAMGEQ